MRLAEALILRADCHKRVLQLQERLQRVAKVQEGDTPAEDPTELLSHLNESLNTLESLIRRINRTNSATEIAPGQTLSDALAQRDVLALRNSAYRAVAKAAAVTMDRLTRSEVRFTSTLPTAKIQRTADDQAKAHRDLDARIQEWNWKTDLLD